MNTAKLMTDMLQNYSLLILTVGVLIINDFGHTLKKEINNIDWSSILGEKSKALPDNTYIKG